MAWGIAPDKYWSFSWPITDQKLYDCFWRVLVFLMTKYGSKIVLLAFLLVFSAALLLWILFYAGWQSTRWWVRAFDVECKIPYCKRCSSSRGQIEGHTIAMSQLPGDGVSSRIQWRSRTHYLHRKRRRTSTLSEYSPFPPSTDTMKVAVLLSFALSLLVLVSMSAAATRPSEWTSDYSSSSCPHRDNKQKGNFSRANKRLCRSDFSYPSRLFLPWLLLKA